MMVKATISHLLALQFLLVMNKIVPSTHRDLSLCVALDNQNTEKNLKIYQHITCPVITKQTTDQLLGDHQRFLSTYLYHKQ